VSGEESRFVKMSYGSRCMYRWVWVTVECFYSCDRVERGFILGASSKWYTVREECVKEGRDWITTQTHRIDTITGDHYTAPYMLIQEDVNQTGNPAELKPGSLSVSGKFHRWILGFVNRMGQRGDKADGYVEKMSSKYFTDPEECFKDGEKWLKNDTFDVCGTYRPYLVLESVELDER
jgi:hypothetical protein